MFYLMDVCILKLKLYRGQDELCAAATATTKTEGYNVDCTLTVSTDFD